MENEENFVDILGFIPSFPKFVDMDRKWGHSTTRGPIRTSVGLTLGPFSFQLN